MGAASFNLVKALGEMKMRAGQQVHPMQEPANLSFNVAEFGLEKRDHARVM
jgi:hypothetical protein